MVEETTDKITDGWANEIELCFVWSFDRNKNLRCDYKIVTNIYLQSGSGCSFEDFTYSLLAFGRTLQVRERVDFLRHCASFLRLDRFLLHFGQFPNSGWIISKILFVAHQDYWYIWTKVLHLWVPLLWYVFQRIRWVNRETHQYNIRVRVAEWTETIVIFLSSRIPKS